MSKLGIPAQALPLMKPWAVTLMLLMPQQDPAGVLDNMLHDIARAQMKRMNTQLKKRALDERNMRMAEHMQLQLKAGRAFIAVGALHLYGERSVLALLESRGYRISRVY